MKKQIIAMMLSAAVITGSYSTGWAKMMYAPDGKTADVAENEANALRNSGWYDYPVMMIYSADGVSFPIAQNDKNDWLGYGWYAYPVMMIYSPDGTSFPIAQSDKGDWLDWGWYDYPVARVYAPDGRSEVIAASALDDWKAVGWYDYPVVRVYAPDGRSEVIATSAVDDWVKVGWNNPAAVDESIRNYEKEVIRLVNEARAEYGLAPLAEDENLSKVARTKSRDMRDNKYFSHTSPNYGSSFDMMADFGIKFMTAGENIAYGYTTPAAVVNGWLNSPGHRANIMNASFTTIGVGYAKDGNYWTQMFIG